ncbi:MAG: sortase [Candidatus Pacebacteria bacterium]|nr:sortase [Candidatus Paceibacterota bacterium]
MHFLKPEKIGFFLLFLGLGLYFYLTVPYGISLIKLVSLAGSGVSYALKDRQGLSGGESVLIKPVSTNFGIVITRLGINRKITPEVNLYDPQKLAGALRGGPAHAGLSALPGEFGAVLLVGHPLDSFFNFAHFNPDFYLIDKLVIGDEIVIFYHGFEYVYRVTKKELVPSNYLDFFDPGEEDKLVLVSGFPPGMALKYRVVEAEEIN